MISLMDNELQIFFARSKLRIKVLKELEEKEQIASFLAKKLEKHRETVSRILLNLQEKGLAKCTNPDSPNFRSYKITQKGKNILKKILEN
jgi:DNA-binding PadR family transcriptional regulator